MSGKENTLLPMALGVEVIKGQLSVTVLDIFP